MSTAPRTVGPLNLHESSEHQKIVGILGGMGPWATVDLMSRILKLTPTEKEWDHIRVIVDSNVKIPSRTRSLLFDEPSPAAGMIDSINRLGAYPVDFVVIPCNSASHFLPDVLKHVQTPVLNIVDIVSDKVVEGGSRNPGLMGGMVPWKGGVYTRAMEARGRGIVLPDAETQDKTASIIERLKQMDKGPETLELLDQVLAHLVGRGADSLILGCTEFSLIEEEIKARSDLPIYLSTDLLAQEVVAKAMGTH